MDIFLWQPATVSCQLLLRLFLFCGKYYRYDVRRHKYVFNLLRRVFGASLMGLMRNGKLVVCLCLCN